MVSTAVFNKDVQNPIAYAQSLVAQEQEAATKAGAAAAKRSQANAKELSEMMKVGDDWGIKFREPMLARVSDFRGKIRKYAAGGGEASDPAFQEWYYNESTRLKSDAQKGKYVEKQLAEISDKIEADPYRDLATWQKEMLPQLQDEDGNWADPSTLDLEGLEASEKSMAAYLVDKAAQDFVKNSPEDILQKINQEKLRYGMVGTSIEETKSKLYEVNPDGSIALDSNGAPKIKLTDDWVSQWNGDPDRKQWLSDAMTNAMEERGVDYKFGTPEYDMLQKEVLDPVLRPWAVHDSNVKRFSARNEPNTKETAAERTARKSMENAQYFTEAVRAYQRGDELTLIESNPKVESVTRRKDGTDLVVMKDGTEEIIDHTKSDGDYQKIYNLASYPGRKPTAAELQKAAETEGKAGAVEKSEDFSLAPEEIEDYKYGRSDAQDLVGSTYNGQEIEKVTRDKTTRWFSPNEFNYTLELANGEKVKLNFADATNYENIQRKAAKKKKPTPEPKKPDYTQEQQDSITSEGLKNIDWEM